MFKVSSTLFLFLTSKFKNLTAFFSQRYTWLLNNATFMLFVKITFFIFIILLVNTSSVPFYEKIPFFHSKVEEVYLFFCSSTTLFLSNFTGESREIFLLKSLTTLLKEKLNAFNTYSELMSSSIDDVLKSIKELFTTTSSLKEDIDLLSKALDALRKQLLEQDVKHMAALKVINIHDKQIRAHTVHLNKVLESVKTPIPGTFTAGQGMGSKITSNRPK